MTKKRIAYVVTDGCYSDYSIYAVFSTKAKAERYSDEYCKNREMSSRGNIEEWILDEADDHVSKDVFRCAISVVSGEITSEWSFKEIVPRRQRSEKTRFDNAGVTVVGSYVSKNHARKLAAEARQKRLRDSSGGAA